MLKSKLPNLETLKKHRNDGWSLQMIANEYGVSRERVRQKLGNTGKDFLRNWTVSQKEKGLSVKTKKDSLLNFGLKSVWLSRWSDNRHEATGGAAKDGQKWEEIVSTILSERGIENKLMPNAHPFDILTSSGIRIDVKARAEIKNISSYSLSFKETKSRSYCDFIVLALKEHSTFFVIPEELINYKSPIRFSYPPRSKKSKWHVFENRFDLLEGGRNYEELIKTLKIKKVEEKKMPRPLKTKDEEISRSEATFLLWYVTEELKKPHPKGGFYYFLHRSPAEIAKEYRITVDTVLTAARRKVAENAKA